ncbi:hypothetical protein DPEC_G00160530 [Dallia pectoralis]|uniref:Uncharacterized protein n=1 Tax=Dallia pectoralis TaxID=75939 RepID=A0ACC2GGD3_DALPE|nr:hypothetical protein DPEC_G00160530 [Dallia pectoralis]
MGQSLETQRRRRNEESAYSRTGAATGSAGVDDDLIEVPYEWTHERRSSPSFLSQRAFRKRPASSPVPGSHRYGSKRAATANSVWSGGHFDDHERPVTSSSLYSANQTRPFVVGLSSDKETQAPLVTKPNNSSTSTPRVLEPTGGPDLDLDSRPAAGEPRTTAQTLIEPRKSPEPTENNHQASAEVIIIQEKPLPPRAGDSYTSSQTATSTTPTKPQTAVSERELQPESRKVSWGPLPERPARAPTSPARAPERVSLSQGLGVQTSMVSPVPCNYCPSDVSLPAVKTCLVCGASMCSEHLRHHLESPVFRSHTLVPPVDDISPWRCQEHQEINRIYCRQCSTCVCTVCTDRVIGSHRDHECVSIREAEDELRRKLKEEMKTMQITEKTILSRVTELTEKKQSFQVLLGEAHEGVEQQYKVMIESLKQEEATALRCISQEESRAVGGLEEHLTQLQESLASLQHGLHALEGLADSQGTTRVQEQAFIMEYNRISRSVSESCSVKELETPEEVDVARLRFLQEWSERRLDSMITLPERDPFRLLYGTSPSLDPDTAHPKLILSEENRRVTYSEIQQAYPEQAARFSSFPQVLASEPLWRGRTYWEVEVLADEGKWKVGVCEGQIGRKGQKDTCRIGFNPYSWCLLSERGVIEALHDKVSFLVEVDELERVGVLLDLDEDSLSFYKVAPGGALSLLYCFKQKFREPLYPVLAVSKTQLTITDLFQTHSAP